MKKFSPLFISGILALCFPLAGNAQAIHDGGYSGPAAQLPPAYLGSCDSLNTTYTGGNGSDGNMFSIEARQDIIIESFEGNISSSGTFKIYYRMGTYAGFEGNAAAWTLIDSASVTSNGAGVPTQIPIPVDMQIDSGDVVSFYITGNGDGGSVDYTDGTLEGDTFSINNDIIFYEGIGLQYPFGTSFSPRIWNGTINYCPNINYCDKLSTGITGGNGNSGIVFEMVALQSTIVSGFETLLSDTGNVYIYYKVGPYVGTTTTPGAWTLVDSAFIETAGPTVLTEIPIDVDLYMPAGSLYSFLITANGMDNQGIEYSDGVSIGAPIINDNTLQIRTGEGFSAPWGGGNGLPRDFNGIVSYCNPEAGQTVICQDIFTEVGGNSNNGIMFDIDARTRPVEIESFEAYFLSTGMQEVRIYHKTGTHIGFETDTNAWTLIDSMSIDIPAAGFYTIPVPVNVEIAANAKAAFFIHNTFAINYSDGTGVTVPDTIFTQDNYVRIHEGTGKSDIFGIDNYNPRVFNGYVNYCALDNFIGVENEITAGELSIWPNPSNGIFNVAVPETENLQQLEILNMEGRLIRSMQQASGAQLSVDITGQAPGIYFVKIRTDKGFRTQKIVLSGN